MEDRVIARSPHHKYYPDRFPDDIVYENEKGEPIEHLPKDCIDTHIRIYEDRVKEWFLKYGKELPHNAGFVVLQVALAQIEGIVQYYTGESSRDCSECFFITGMKMIVPGLSEADNSWLKKLYKDCRCGLFHDGMTRPGILIENTYPEPLGHDKESIIVSPSKLLDRVCSFFEKYIEDLRKPENTILRNSFEKMWQSRATSS